MSPTPCHPSSWSDLPVLILELILKCLCFHDAARFAAVCKSWRNVAENNIHVRSLSFPWVVVPRQSVTNRSWFFYSPMEARAYYKTFCSPTLWSLLDTSTPWLLMHDDFSTNRIFFLNPLTEKRILLPSYQDWPIRFTTVVTSSSPSDTTCVVAALDECFKFVSCMPGDSEWFVFRHWWTEKEPIVDIIFFQGLLYAVTLNHKVLVFDFGPTHLPICRSVCTFIGRAQADKETRSETVYLVESKGKLLMVLKYRYDDEDADEDVDDEAHITRCKASVYELDLSVPHWSEVSELGDEILVIGSRCSLSIPAENVLRSGFRRNCVYFTDVDSLSKSCEFLEFCLEDHNSQTFLPMGFPPIKSPFHWLRFKGKDVSVGK